MTDKIYELGRAIGEGRSLAYLKDDWEETKEDAKKIYGGISSAAKWTGNNLGSLLVKATYPLTGQLSLRVRDTLEESLGNKIFNSKHAGIASAVANFIAYPALAIYLARSLGVDSNNVATIGIGSFLYGFYEFTIIRPLQKEVRNEYTGNYTETSDFSVPIKASLPGKIISLPLEAIIGIHKGIKSKRVGK